jgi:penicillin-binding protein 2
MMSPIFGRWSRSHEIDPDEIFLDSSNLPDHDAGHFEGKVERPVSRRAVFLVGAFFMLVAFVFGGRAMQLELMQGTAFAEISRENVLQSSITFATRGLIYDRTGRELAWNEMLTPTSGASTTEDFARRKYSMLPGLSHIIGWVRYPKQDRSGAWWREEYSGMSGVELAYDEALAGTNGSIMVESDARGRLQRENIVSPPERGDDLKLSIDAEVQSKLYEVLHQHALNTGFVGGASIIMDVETGELLALTSFPEYDNQAFTDGDSASVSSASNDAKVPLLNRAISGLYTPGSIVKPIFAAAALKEKLISPEKEIVSTGAISIPNPYDPENPTLFRDWAVHGAVDMREAIAVSSDEYFYTIGGGFGGQRGLGIEKLDKYSQNFGLSIPTGIALLGEEDGVIPTPEWKEKTFDGDPWRIGNTYHTAIGQYGFQITPIQAVRFTAAIANGGKLLTPQLLASSTAKFVKVDMSDDDLQIVREGMRLAVTSPRFDATVKSLYIAGIPIAGKTGTAQIGSKNQYMNSWVIGFWPAEKPRYAFATVLEKAPAGTLSGAAPGMAPFFYWLLENRPEYINPTD